MNSEFSDDVCRCKWCEAITFIPFDGKQIPISKDEYDEIVFNGISSKWFFTAYNKFKAMRIGRRNEVFVIPPN